MLPNGSIILGYRADVREGTDLHGEYVSVAHANTIEGPFVDGRRIKPAIWEGAAEDPCLWQDERGHWHMLMHNMNRSEPTGMHAFSRDGHTWTRSTVFPFDAAVNFSDGTSTEMKRRERPELLLSKRGQPRYFVSGVMDYDDHTYTLVVKVRASKASDRTAVARERHEGGGA